MRGPSRDDQRLTEFWETILDTVKNAKVDDALAAIAEFFESAGSCVLRMVELPGAPSAVWAFNEHTSHAPLLDALRQRLATQGLVGILRRSQDRSDALVIFRQGLPFDQGDVSWLSLFLPCLRSAMKLAEAPALALPTLLSATHFASVLPTPCVLTDEAGRCVESSSSFQRVVEALGGVVRAGRLMFSDPLLQDAWRSALQDAHATAAAQFLLANAATGSPWKVHVVPFACVADARDPNAQRLMFAFFERYSEGSIQKKVVPSSQPLTKAELQVLASLLMGHTAKAIARSRGASVNTVRSQITAILGKTGHHTQKELIASFSTSTYGDISLGPSTDQ
ncbi:MAG: Bacterial regulatory protein luxR family [Ramlibacter sp.]|jgi:DNA-binding CsgD family transcriptional regulator|nr:Bacterial regulatory protein luxR family [Ramlibacter sp.]